MLTLDNVGCTQDLKGRCRMEFHINNRRKVCLPQLSTPTVCVIAIVFYSLAYIKGALTASCKNSYIEHSFKDTKRQHCLVSAFSVPV